MIRATSTLLTLFTLLALAVSAQTQRETQQPTLADQVIEQGKFHFYETKQIRGEEDYTINRTTGGELFVQAKTTLPFAEQDTKPLVTATLRTRADYTPRTFDITGPTLLEIQENTSIQVNGQAASINDRGANKTLNLPPAYFTLSGYVPV